MRPRACCRVGQIVLRSAFMQQPALIDTVQPVLFGTMEEWSMGRTRALRILLACAAAVVMAGGCAFVEKIEQLTIEDIDVAAVRDGEYRGTVRVLPVTARSRFSAGSSRLRVSGSTPCPDPRTRARSS